MLQTCVDLALTTPTDNLSNKRIYPKPTTMALSLILRKIPPDLHAGSGEHGGSTIHLYLTRLILTCLIVEAFLLKTSKNLGDLLLVVEMN